MRHENTKRCGAGALVLTVAASLGAAGCDAPASGPRAAGAEADAGAAAELEAPLTDPRVAPRGPTLEVGDAAPSLVISEWIGPRSLDGISLAPTLLGSPGRMLVPFEPGVVTMIDFWASWCGPCLASMPHAAALQERHGAVLRVIALTSLDGANTRDAVIRAVDRTESMRRLLVAIDAGEFSKSAYRAASGERALPCSFIVDRTGRLAWIGRPTDADAVIEAILTGAWEIGRERERRRELAEARRRAQAAIEALHRAEALGDADAKLEALRVLAHLPAEAQIADPPYAMRVAFIEQLMQMGRSEEAMCDLAHAAAEARAARDAPTLSALAGLARGVDPGLADSLATEAAVLDRPSAAPLR